MNKSLLWMTLYRSVTFRLINWLKCSFPILGHPKAYNPDTLLYFNCNYKAEIDAMAPPKECPVTKIDALGFLDNNWSICESNCFSIALYAN